VPHPHRVPDLLRVGDRENGVGQSVDVLRLRQEGRASVTRKIRDENTVPLAERGGERPPVLDRPAEAVHEDERRGGRVLRTAERISEPGPAPLELPLLESLESVFAVRPHQGIFFVAMNALAGRAE
jgi:hypothetical protein